MMITYAFVVNGKSWDEDKLNTEACFNEIKLYLYYSLILNIKKTKYINFSPTAVVQSKVHYEYM